MIGSPKEWASLLGYERDSDEKTMAARLRVLARTLTYLEDHFSDPEGPRPPEETVVEFGQFLALAEGMETKGRGAKFKELYETVVALHFNWDETDRGEAFRSIARKTAVIKGIVTFSDAWLGTTTPIPSRGPSPGAAVSPFDDADVKTRIVRPSQLRP